jgi:hypothetical protein
MAGGLLGRPRVVLDPLAHPRGLRGEGVQVES